MNKLWFVVKSAKRNLLWDVFAVVVAYILVEVFGPSFGWREMTIPWGIFMLLLFVSLTLFREWRQISKEGKFPETL